MKIQDLLTKKKKRVKKYYFKYKREEKERKKGPWLTSWQLLRYHNRKVKNGAEPIPIYNTIYDEEDDYFFKSDKCFFYYSMFDTEEVDESEFERLKALYVEKYNGWDEIDLENTSYNGLVWY